MTSRLWAAAFLAACFLSSPLRAQQCRSVDADLADLETVEGVSHEFLAGEEKDRGSRILAALVRHPELSFETVLVAAVPGGIGIMAGGNNGEICFRVILPPDLFRKVRGYIKGTAL